MGNSIAFTSNACTRARALFGLLVITIILAAVTASVWAQDGQQGMQNMPGMDMGKHKAQPTPQQKRKPQPAPKKDEMKGMEMKGMDMKDKQTPAPTPSPTSTPSASPTPSPAKMEMKMPVPQNSPAPAPNESKTGAAQDKPAGMENTNTGDQQGTGQGRDMHSMTETGMPGMAASGTGRVSSAGASTLIVMQGQQMDIRLGESEINTISMGQMGSGTAWQPATTPMHMWTKFAGNWLLFLHGEFKMGFNSQGGPRGGTKAESLNWLMPMAFRRVGPGTLNLRGMFSLEPLTLSKGGTPELFQTGETYKGQPLINKQHPHDLFMELSAMYIVPLGEHATWFGYFGYPGEPALGPVAFMHRWSASENPSAPLAHHLEDSTHISFGVFTTGFTYRQFKAEASIFNGREPDENRYNFEAHPWNSRSIRLSYAPNNNWAMQWSYGILRKPEASETSDQRRMTASLQYNRPFHRGNWASALIWGRNHFYGGDVTANLNGYTAESTVNFLDQNYLYTRLELLDKNELLLPVDRARLGINAEHPSFRISAYTFGGARDIWNTNQFSMAIGADVTFYSKPAILDQVYGNSPKSYKVFLRIRPGKMSESGHNDKMESVPGMGDMSGAGQPQARP